MAEVGMTYARVERAKADTTERFLTCPPRVVGVAVFLLFALTFDNGQVQDDGVYYFDFLREAVRSSHECRRIPVW